MSTTKEELKEERIKKIIDTFVKMEYERFFNQIRPAIKIIKNRGHDIEEFARRIVEDELEEAINNLNLVLRGGETGLGGRLDEMERKYLACILLLKNKLQLDYVLASVIYEGLRSTKMIEDIDKGRRRSQIARDVLHQMTDKGLVKEIFINGNQKQQRPPHIKYLYFLNNGKFIPEIEKFEEYKEMEKYIDTMVKDTRFAKIRKTNKYILELLKQGQE